MTKYMDIDIIIVEDKMTYRALHKPQIPYP